MARKERYVVGLDVGTSTVTCVVAETFDDGRCDVQDNRITGYQVNLLLTFVLDETTRGGGARRGTTRRTSRRRR